MYNSTESSSPGFFATIANLLAHDDKDGNGGRFGRETYKSFIGIVVAICGNILISVALNTQRYAHIKLNEQAAARRKLLKRAERRNLEARQASDGAREQDDFKPPDRNNDYAQSHSSLGENEPLLSSHTDDNYPDFQSKPEAEEAQKSYLKSPYWWAGIILMTVGEGGNFLAYGFAPASIVSPLGVVAIISNCIIAPIFMKEPFRWRDFLGVVVAVGGAVTVVLSASENNPKLGPHEIWDLIARWEFETYLAITIALIICLMMASNKYGQKSVFIDLGLVGLFGGYTALSTKGVASLLSYTLFKALTFPVFYLLVAILVGTAVMQIKYVNRALQRFDSTQVIPTQFVMFTLSVIIGSAVLYRDFEKTRGDAAEKFIGGCALTFLGVWLITSGRPPTTEDDEDYDSDEDAIVLRPGEQYQDDIHVNGASQETLSHPPLIAIQEDDATSHYFSSHPPLSEFAPLQREFSAGSEQGATRPITPDQDSYSIAEGQTSRPAPRLPINARSPSSLQRFLQPLATLFPQQSVKHTAQTLPSVLRARHSTPALPTNTSLQDSPHTPRQTSHDDSAQVSASTSGPGRNRVANKRSLTALYPGPFTSPLSSSLSAMVSDSLRRGIGIRRSRRRAARPRLVHTESSSSQPRYPSQSATTTMTLGSSAPDHNGLLPAFDERISPARVRSYTNDDYYDDDAREIDEPRTPDASGRRRSLSTRMSDFFRLTPKSSGRRQDGRGDDQEPPV